MLLLQQDLERELRGATLLQQADRLMQVDAQAPREDVGLDATAPGAPELLTAPVDDLLLGHRRRVKLRRPHPALSMRLASAAVTTRRARSAQPKVGQSARKRVTTEHE